MNRENIPINNIDSLLRFNPSLLVDGRLEVIVKYNGDILSYSDSFEAIEILNNSYAIITGTTEQIKSLYSYPNTEYVELPKTLTYELSSSRYSTCVTRAQGEPYNLSGKGTVIAIIDSGIDYTHPDFINDDQTSRILYIWDQTTDGNAPLGFRSGSEYTNEQINQALTNPNPFEILDFRDNIGHGTAVSGVAAGNGSYSDGRERGMAPEASLIVVKLGRQGFGAFPRTTEVMRAVKYSIDKATELNMP
ncbi:MAG: peptidase S8 and S53 subtilisin kexin sedolisin, partial [Ruminococcaceae bacterium]|nr:peptidase S8 and S53 subtilisin kexin sedolisin [Oscillospiraceae bacterium]